MSRYTDSASPAHNKHINMLRVVCRALTSTSLKRSRISTIEQPWRVILHYTETCENIKHVHKPNYPYSTHYFRLGPITYRHKRCIYKLMQLCDKPRALAYAKNEVSTVWVRQEGNQSQLSHTDIHPKERINKYRITVFTRVIHALF